LNIFNYSCRYISILIDLFHSDKTRLPIRYYRYGPSHVTACFVKERTTAIQFNWLRKNIRQRRHWEAGRREGMQTAWTYNSVGKSDILTRHNSGHRWQNFSFAPTNFSFSAVSTPVMKPELGETKKMTSGGSTARVLEWNYYYLGWEI